MTVWRYEAVALDAPGSSAPGSSAPGSSAPGASGTPGTPGAPSGGRLRGEVAATSEVEARAALRRIGLQTVGLWPARRAAMPVSVGGQGGLVARAVRDAWHARRRRRRRPARAQLFDGMGTMIRCGVPLLEAVETLAAAGARGGGRSRRAMLLELREGLRSGDSLAAAMRAQPGWFDPVEVAMVEAGQHGGTLPQVLESLSERHEQESRLAARLVGALLYPSVVALAGVGVAVFLSVRTLPELARILEGADVPVPATTRAVMAAGQWIAQWGWLLGALVACAALGAAPLAALAARRGRGAWSARLVPGVVRTMAVAEVSVRLGELVRCGVPVTEALRVLAPTTRAALGRLLVGAAERVERGEELGEALCDGRWFDEEFRRLLAVAQASGELDSMLDRVGRRHEREARRLVDRLATLLEPAAIVLLALLVGTVVMAAVLPLVRLKDAL